MSSEKIERGFCNTCGTPLFYRNLEKQHISMTTGCFDHPEDIPVLHQFGNEARQPQIEQLATLPHTLTTEEDEPELAANTKVTTKQHPDHDTGEWPA